MDMSKLIQKHPQGFNTKERSTGHPIKLRVQLGWGQSTPNSCPIPVALKTYIQVTLYGLNRLYLRIYLIHIHLCVQ